eukprot:11489420-Alexandrium_andersonii.AAC.1
MLPAWWARWRDRSAWVDNAVRSDLDDACRLGASHSTASQLPLLTGWLRGVASSGLSIWVQLAAGGERGSPSSGAAGPPTRLSW